MLPPLYERWLDGLSKGEEEPPISSLEFQRLGMSKRMDYVSGLGFGERLTECMKEELFEDDDFERAIYHIVDGSADLGRERALVAISNAAENILIEAADALEVVLENLECAR